MTTPNRPSEADALWASVLAMGSNENRTRNRKRKRKRSSADAHSDILTELARMNQQVVSTPWTPIALVLPIVRYTCACGQVYEIPSHEPLVRFQHKRTRTIVEKANHPTRWNTHLPRIHRTVGLLINFCQGCFQEGANAESPTEPPKQLDLFTQEIPIAPVRTATVTDYSEKLS